jgi:hypothetical protein
VPAFDNYSEQPPTVAPTTGQVSVGTTAVLLCTPTNTDAGVLINNGGSVVVYIGSSTVTASTGFPIAAAGTVTLGTIAGIAMPIYAVAASSTATVSYAFAP